MSPRVILLFFALAALGHAAAADDPAARQAELQKTADAIVYRRGDVVVGKDLARIAIPTNFRYIDSKDAETVLSTLWGNPRNPDLLGAIVPAGFDPTEGGNWLVAITYDEDGYVKDDDAKSIDYPKLLTQMQETTRTASAERVKQGFGAVQLIGWAEPPRYDAASHKMYWAKELKFGDEKENTLNYNVRILGRHGVLVLNAVAGMHQLREVEAATPAILAMVNFREGNRYTDFNVSTDKVATYGLAALVAGGIAAKVGFFKLLWVGILALKKVILFAAVAVASYAKRFVAWIRGRKVDEVAAAPTPPGPT
jgi:uncharacterized membrane-anchored protein